MVSTTKINSLTTRPNKLPKILLDAIKSPLEGIRVLLAHSMKMKGRHPVQKLRIKLSPGRTQSRVGIAGVIHGDFKFRILRINTYGCMLARLQDLLTEPLPLLRRIEHKMVRTSTNLIKVPGVICRAVDMTLTTEFGGTKHQFMQPARCCSLKRVHD